MTIDQINKLPEGEGKMDVKVVAKITKMNPVKTSLGQYICFVEIEDSSAHIECIIMPKEYEEYKEMLKVNKTYEIEGMVNLLEIVKKIIPSKIKFQD